MCVPVFGLGKVAGGLFLGSLGLSLATGLSQRNAAIAAADRTYQSALIANRSLEQSFARQQEATAAQLKETRASQAQEKLAKTIEGLQAKGRIRASEQAGLTVQMLLRDQERQTANFRESINQAMESQSRQYTRVVQGLTANRDNTRNQLQSNINQAYNQIPTLGSVLLNTAVSGLNSYVGLTGGLGGIGSSTGGTPATAINTGSSLYFA
tara:strand:+ start:1599 stop:2228 length:630 start_codon:yes stop_codon:yes gene_type:complete